LVLDEADRMFDMGFQNDVERIIYACPKERQTMLFSATISQDIDYLAKKHTKNAAEISVESYIDKSKLKQVYYNVQNNLKFSLLVHLLKSEKSKLVMVFCSSRRNVDFVAKNLYKVGICASPLHGGMSQNKRTSVLQGFHNNKVDVLVCTDVAARGLDIPAISHVYNYDLPRTSDDYIHRVGRTARAGKEGIAINLLADRDYDNFRRIEQDHNLKIECVDTPQVDRIEMKRDFNSNRRDDSRGRNNYRGKPNSQASHKRGSGNSDRRDSDRRDSNRRNSDRRNPDRRDGFRGRKISRGGRSSDSRNYSRR
jgi:ATP-dependent RNA helicase DeaD